MGILRHVSSGKMVLLSSYAVAGRAPSRDVVLAEPAASTTHASISWTGERWEARDLGSTNGTSVDGRSLEPKENVPLALGAVLRFGSDAERWELTDARGPVVVARSLSTGEEHAAENGLLALPGPHDVIVSIVLDVTEKWMLEAEDGSRRPIRDGERISAGGQTWALAVPPDVPTGGTYKARTAKNSVKLATATLHFYVSPGDEHVHIEARDGDGLVKLEERASFFLLLLLARERIEDSAKSELAEAERGWMHVIDAGAALRKDEQRVNSDVHRAREALAKAGVEGADGIVERRPREIRIGTGRLRVTGG